MAESERRAVVAETAVLKIRQDLERLESAVRSRLGSLPWDPPLMEATKKRSAKVLSIKTHSTPGGSGDRLFAAVDVPVVGPEQPAS